MALELETIPECDLGFLELNADRDVTVLFIHGALSSPMEASLVTPHLTDYHIIIPAIHSNVKALDPPPPFSFQTICSQLSTLIRTRARNGQAHIYGHSMGAHLALNLAMWYPDQIMTVIASGAGRTSHWPSWKRAVVPHFIYAQALLPRTILPMSAQIKVFNMGMRPASEAIAADWMAQPVEGDWTLCKQMCAEFNQSLRPDRPLDIRARTLIVAGTATIGDTVDDVRWIVNAIRKERGDAKGIEIKKGGHPWILQLPELCAQVIRAWIGNEDLPAGASNVD